MICLITAPVSTDFENPELARTQQVRASTRAPKLGVLTLAAALEQAGVPAQLYDLDRAYDTYLQDGGLGLEHFPKWVAPKILASGAQLFAFSSLCSSYPLTIRVASALKALDPDSAVLFGGPQASVVDLQTLAAFPSVDFILRGEADRSLLWFVEEWAGAKRFSRVQGLTWRSAFGPQRNGEAPLIEDLDELPLPAYHLSPDIREAQYAFLELGRGCPFSCTFCSTNDFFRRKFRVKSPERMLSDMRRIAADYGFRGFNLVHDMFTVDRRKVVAFCEALVHAGEDFAWSCSARTDCVDDELLELMARAGCNGIFYGIETGSARMQRLIDKDLDPVQNRKMVEKSVDLGMGTTVSTIVGFPEENTDDLRQTIEVYMHALALPDADPQLNILAPLAGTPIHIEYRKELCLDELGSSLAYLGSSQSASDRELVRRHPEIFPNFYLLPIRTMERGTLQELVEFLWMCRDRLRWLLLAVYRHEDDILRFFHTWREHRMAIHPAMTSGMLRNYYSRGPVQQELLAFLRSRLREFDGPGVGALLECHEKLRDAAVDPPKPPAGQLATGRMRGGDVPIRAPGVNVVELGWDIQRVIDSLKRREDAPHRCDVKHYRTAPGDPGESSLVEVTALVGRALALCDGKHTVKQFCSEAGLLFDCPGDLRHYAARSLLVQLRQKGHIDMYRLALQTRHDAAPSAQARSTAQPQIGGTVATHAEV